ncbi:MAG TPA: hypothetical protein VFC44_05400 [Candidatus Saccharimonadales bacterium]|nr:hypothetical protein [Candidatus Saccharimonadales bacterium]
MLHFDMFGNLADGFFAFGRDAFGFSFSEKAEEVNQVAIWQIKIEDAGSAAGTFAFAAILTLRTPPQPTNRGPLEGRSESCV